MTPLSGFVVPPHVQRASDEARALSQPADITAWTDGRTVEYRVGGVCIYQTARAA